MKDEVIHLEKDGMQESTSRSGSDSRAATIDVLIIDEAEKVQSLLAGFVYTGRPSWQVKIVASVEEGLELAEHIDFDCLVLSSDNRANLRRMGSFFVSHNVNPMAVVVLEETVSKISLAYEYEPISVLPKWDMTQELLCKAIESEIERAHLLHTLERQTRELDAYRKASAVYARNYNEFAHEMLTPLAVVQEFVSLVFDGVAGPTTEQQRKYLAYARGDCSNIQRLVDSKVAFDELSWMSQT